MSSVSQSHSVPFPPSGQNLRGQTTSFSEVRVSQIIGTVGEAHEGPQQQNAVHYEEDLQIVGLDSPSGMTESENGSPSGHAGSHSSNGQTILGSAGEGHEVPAVEEFQNSASALSSRLTESERSTGSGHGRPRLSSGRTIGFSGGHMPAIVPGADEGLKGTQEEEAEELKNLGLDFKVWHCVVKLSTLTILNGIGKKVQSGAPMSSGLDASSQAGPSNAAAAPLLGGDHQGSLESLDVGPQGLDLFLPVVAGEINAPLLLCIRIRYATFFLVPGCFAVWNVSNAGHIEQIMQNYEFFDKYLFKVILLLTFLISSRLKQQALQVWLPVKLKVLRHCIILGAKVKCFLLYFLWTNITGALASVHLLFVAQFIMEGTAIALQEPSKWENVFIVGGTLPWLKGLPVLWALHFLPLFLHDMLTLPSGEAAVPNLACANKVIFKDDSEAAITPPCPITSRPPEDVRFVARWNTALVANVSHGSVFAVRAYAAQMQSATDALPDYLTLVFTGLSKTKKASVQGIHKWFEGYISMATLFIIQDYFMNEARVMAVEVGDAGLLTRIGLGVGLALQILCLWQNLRAIFTMFRVVLENHRRFSAAEHPANLHLAKEHQLYTEENEGRALRRIVILGMTACLVHSFSGYFHFKLLQILAPLMWDGLTS